MAKSLKTINGVRILKRHSAASFFTGLFSFAIIGALVALYFLPFISVVNNVDSANPVETTIGILDIVKALFGQEPEAFLTEINNVALAINATWLPDVMHISLIACAIVIIIAALLCIILLFAGLEHLFKGYSHHLKNPRNLAWVITMLCLFPLCVAPLTIQILVMTLSNKIDPFPFDIVGYWPIIVFGGAFIVSILLSITYAAGYKERIFVGDIHELTHSELNPSTNKNETQTPNYTINPNVENDLARNTNKNKTSTKKNLTLPKVVDLPKNIRNIGGHAFAENLQLTVANIPYGITSLGIGAFANCLYLKQVSIPRSVKKISRNCFFNCASLKRISYSGTKEQWRHIVRGSNWLMKAGTCEVVCLDGPILVDPYR